MLSFHHVHESVTSGMVGFYYVETITLQISWANIGDTPTSGIVSSHYFSGRAIRDTIDLEDQSTPPRMKGKWQDFSTLHTVDTDAPIILYVVSSSWCRCVLESLAAYPLVSTLLLINLGKNGASKRLPVLVHRALRNLIPAHAIHSVPKTLLATNKTIPACRACPAFSQYLAWDHFQNHL
jgi:hypothetical protein